MPQPKRAGRHDADWTLENYQASSNLKRSHRNYPKGKLLSTFEALWKGFAVLLIPMFLIIPLFNAIGLHAIGVVIYVAAVWIGFMALGDEDRKR